VKQKFQPGGELDLLTESELRKTLGEVLRGLTISPAQVRTVANGKTDGAGALTLPVFDVPMGMGFFLTRLLVRIDGATVAVPFTGAGAMLEVLRNDILVDFKSLVAAAAVPAGLPALMTYGEDSAEWFANGDVVAVRLTAVTINANVVASIKGKLQPLVVGN
jgi:hypothetical protein